ncbi:hypothetical protein BDV40DRAFT_104887 [Aspergillus tamarii]|uniref:Uncharacterized protein n=1 Tax=Aspergillus tamarii TaxID=41984 RepID=A0A5N6UC17_ASPTM|nr:hypothetical protein BDV40DRAFT_104887 [Aspergillus tamarii]
MDMFILVVVLVVVVVMIFLKISLDIYQSYHLLIPTVPHYGKKYSRRTFKITYMPSRLGITSPANNGISVLLCKPLIWAKLSNGPCIGTECPVYGLGSD